MSKKKFIAISIFSILAVLIMLMIVLFGAVCRLRNQSVFVVGDEDIFTFIEGEKVPITNEQIIQTAGLKNGKSTFLLDKQKAINNIEYSYPYIKVIQISTTGARSIQIRITMRHEMFSYKDDLLTSYFILDEDLKVLRITRQEEEGLIPIKANIEDVLADETEISKLENFLNINSESKVGDFLGDSYYRNVFKNLFVSMSKTVLVDNNSDLRFNEVEYKTISQRVAEGELHYITRDDIKNIITNIQLKKGRTLTETYTRIVLTTNTGIKIDIAKPETNLQHKVNLCFSTISQMNEQNFAESGTVRFGYDANGKEQIGYYYDKSLDKLVE